MSATDDGRWKLRHGPFELDLLLRTLRVDGLPCELAPVQFCMLAYMLAHRGRAITSEEFFLRVLRSHHERTSSSVRNQIAAIRRELGAHGYLLQTQRACGYGFDLAIGATVIER